MRAGAVWLAVWMSMGVAAQHEGADTLSRFHRAYFDGIRLLVTGDPRAAADRLEASLDLVDTVAAVYYYLAVAYRDSDRPALALDMIDKALAWDEENKWYHKLKIELLRGRPSTEKKFDARTRRNGFAAEAAVVDSARHLIRTLPPEQAWERVAALAMQYPFYPGVLYEAARAAFELGKYDETIRILEGGTDFVADRPELARAYYRLLADAYRRKGNEARARMYEEKWRKLEK
ncbi:MAG: hypothetical protein GXO27_06065 [Chlorobi bacterium]|nr:hypothetical protein [Chlorobiota bacterium]